MLPKDRLRSFAIVTIICKISRVSRDSYTETFAENESGQLMPIGSAMADMDRCDRLNKPMYSGLPL